MRTYVNPFRVRASEYQTNSRTFVRHFGPAILDILPERIFEQPLVIRSAPGGGKTSLMRLFTLESLRCVAESHDSELDALRSGLERVGALDSQGPRVMGVHVNVARDYGALSDLELDGHALQRLFWRLLNSRVIATAIHDALKMRDLKFPLDSVLVEFRPLDHTAEDALRRLGGGDGSDLTRIASEAEGAVLDVLDSLSPRSLDNIEGHADFYALKVLRGCEIFVDGEPIRARPFVMLDDGNELPEQQRALVFERLTDRVGGVGLWYSERLEALSARELLSRPDASGRTFLEFEIEPTAQDPSPALGNRRSNSRWFSRFLQEVGDKRAAWHLHNYADEIEPFSALLTPADAGLTTTKVSEILDELSTRVITLATESERYREVPSLLSTEPFADPTRRRELLIMLERDRARPQRDLFSEHVDSRGLVDRSDSQIRGAAHLFLCREFKLPYYAGPDCIAKLSSFNVEQFLQIAGDVFEDMLALITTGRKPEIDPVRQDRIIRRASAALWESLPRRVPHGRDVKDLLTSIAMMAERETLRPNAPYAPGVTGIAIFAEEQATLLREESQGRLGLASLLAALRSAIAHNLLEVKREVRVKGKLVMVLYLNRLLCPRFGLPLERGGFREKRIAELATWVGESTTRSQLNL